MFPDDATAQAWFVEKRWPDGPYCPACGSVNVQTGAKHAMPFRCRERQCRKRFSVKLGTVMQGSNLGHRLREAFGRDGAMFSGAVEADDLAAAVVQPVEIDWKNRPD